MKWNNIKPQRRGDWPALFVFQCVCHFCWESALLLLACIPTVLRNLFLHPSTFPGVFHSLPPAPSSAWQAVRCPERSLTVNCSPQRQPLSCSRCPSKAVNTIYSLSSSERSLCFLATKRAVTFNGWYPGCSPRKTVCNTRSLLAPFLRNECSII